MRWPGRPPEYADFILLGRQLSTVFALLLIVVVWAMGRASGLSPPMAGVVALLMGGLRRQCNLQPLLPTRFRLRFLELSGGAGVH